MHESMSLGQRHVVEEEFHDRKARRTRPRSAHVDFYSVVNEEHFQKLLDAAGSLSGKRVLDFGCGLGQTSRFYAEHGATRVDGFDISGESIRIAKKNALRDNLDDRVIFRQLAAEDIDYPDNSFDIVIGKAILHHTDIEKTARQLRRVLAPGGVACFLEPLAHNPFINLFRWLTPWRRTPTEKPLSLQDLSVFGRYLSVEYRGFYLLTLFADFLLLLTGSRALFVKTHIPLRSWEDRLLERIPFLQRYCWSMLVIFRKALENPSPRL